MSRAYSRIIAFDVLIAVAWWLLAAVLPEPLSWLLLGALHLALPIYAHRCADPGLAWNAFVAGPGLVAGVYVLLLVRQIVKLWGGYPEDTWLAWLLVLVCAAATGLFALYSLLATAYLERRRLGRHKPHR